MFLFEQVKCFDWDADGGHDLIGEFKTNFNHLMTASGKVHVRTAPCITLYSYTSLYCTMYGNFCMPYILRIDGLGEVRVF